MTSRSILVWIIAAAHGLQISRSQSVCGSVVDAGSSGSRLFIHHCDLIDNSLHDCYAAFEQSVDGGWQSTPESERDAYWQNLFRNSTQALEEHCNQTEADTPLVIAATAGMRQATPEDQHDFVQSTSDWVARSTHYNNATVEIIPGTREAWYDWLAVNTQFGKFSDDCSTPLFSVIDVGGASIEWAYETDQIQSLPHGEQWQFDQGCRQQIKLALSSWLGLGTDQVIAATRDATECYAPNLPIVDSPTGYGQGDYRACVMTVTDFIASQPFEFSVPGLSYHAVQALSAVYYTAKDLAIDNPVSAQAWRDAGSEACSNHTDLLDDFAWQRCLTSSLIDTVLLQPANDRQINTLHTINGTSITWTLGVMAELFTATHLSNMTATQTSHSDNSMGKISQLNLGIIVGVTSVLVFLAVVAYTDPSIRKCSTTCDGLFGQSSKDSLRQGLLDYDIENLNKESGCSF